MKYLLMIYSDEAMDAARSKEDLEAEMREYFGFTQAIRQAGVYVAGAPLHPTTTATTVRVREGKMTTTDGPFAETREQLGGYYLVDCANLDEAIEWAAKIPHAKLGSIEIRPIIDFSQSQGA